MKLTLIYHVYKNTTNLDVSLNSIASQSNKDFEFILINDGASTDVFKILKKYDFMSFCKNYKYICLSENQGHAFSFNESIKNCENDYVYYFGSNIILKPNFVKVINYAINYVENIDVISLSHVVDKKPLITVYQSLKSDLRYNINPSIRDKIFSKSFLKQHDIWLNEEGYFPLELLYKVFLNFKQWVLVNDEIVKYLNNNSFAYNLYDIFLMGNLLITKYSKTIFWKNNKDLIEFLMIVYVTRIFLSRIFLIYKDKFTRRGALNYSKNWLNLNIPKWKQNPILNSKKSDLSEHSRERILNIFEKRFFKSIGGV